MPSQNQPATQHKQSKNAARLLWTSIFSLSIITIGTATTVFLSGQRQDIRQQAQAPEQNCQTVNFDTLPGGNPIDGTVNLLPDHNFPGTLISNQYASLGVTFSSDNGRPTLATFAAPGQNYTSSQPNFLIATRPNGSNSADSLYPINIDFSEPTTSVSLDAISVGAAGLRILAYDATGNLLDEQTMSGAGDGAFEVQNYSVTGDVSRIVLQRINEQIATDGFGIDNLLFCATPPPPPPPPPEGCQLINFDTLPNGDPISGTTSLLPDHNFPGTLISNQYASLGVTFSSDNGRPTLSTLAAPGQNVATSQTNFLIGTRPNGSNSADSLYPIYIDFSTDLSSLSLDAISVGSAGLRIQAFDSSGNLLDEQTLTGQGSGSFDAQSYNTQGNVSRIELRRVNEQDSSDGYGIDNLLYCSTPVEVVSEFCPLVPAGPDDILLPFNERLRASQSEDEAKTTIDANVPPGNYQVTLRSFDNHSGRPPQIQPNEQFHLIFQDSIGGTITQSNSLSDIPDDADQVIEVVDSSLSIPQEASSVTAFHSAFPSSNVNSIDAICGLLTPVPACNPNPNLQYFGYYNVHGAFNNNISAQYVDDLPLTNANIFHTFALSQINLSDQLDKARAHNLMAVIDLRTILFSYYASPTINTTGQDVSILYGDWQTRLDDYYSQNMASYSDVIWGISIDQPVWRGISENDFRAITNHIRANYPNLRVMAVEASPIVERDLVPEKYFEFATDLGLVYYYSVQGATWERYLSIYNNHFLPIVTTQSIWLIPDGYTQTNDVAALQQALDNHYGLASSNNNIVGMMVFNFQDYADSSDIQTAYDFIHPQSINHNPEYLAQTQTIASCISETRSVTTTSSVNECPTDINDDQITDITDFSLFVLDFFTTNSRSDFNGDGTVDISDYSLLVSQFLQRCPAPGPPTPTITPANSSPITSFTLINADTNQDIRQLSTTDTISLGNLPTQNLNIRANTTPEITAVSFSGYYTQSEGVAPFALFGDNSGNYIAGTFTTGTHTITATPSSGTPLTLTLTVNP